MFYLDSFDVNFDNPHASALHHLKELAACGRFMNENCIIFVDDHKNAKGQIGRSLYVSEYMKAIGAELIIEARQIAWTVRSI